MFLYILHIAPKNGDDSAYATESFDAAVNQGASFLESGGWPYNEALSALRAGKPCLTDNGQTRISVHRAIKLFEASGARLPG